MSKETIVFYHQDLDKYLNALAKEIKKSCGRKANCEIIIVGGASILLNYSFREMTADVDAYYSMSSAITDAIHNVANEFNLDRDWVNNDFMKTKSYTPKIIQFSKPYKTFCQVLSVRVITGEYLVAMKLCSGREYKNDLSDIVGILSEHKKNGSPLTFQQIDKAVCDLYGGWNVIDAKNKKFIENAISNDNYNTEYNIRKEKEITTRATLIEFENDYPNVVNEDNIQDILSNLNH